VAVRNYYLKAAVSVSAGKIFCQMDRKENVWQKAAFYKPEKVITENSGKQKKEIRR